MLADLADQSVDAIVTDPPYDNDGVPLYEPLGAFCSPRAEARSPGGRLCRPPPARPRDGAARPRRAHLHVARGERAALAGTRRSACAWSTASTGRVLLYSAGPYRPRTWLNDVVFAEGRGGPEERPLHPWQQALEPVRHWVRQVSEPGELIVDPFLGPERRRSQRSWRAGASSAATSTRAVSRRRGGAWWSWWPAASFNPKEMRHDADDNAAKGEADRCLGFAVPNSDKVSTLCQFHRKKRLDRAALGQFGLST